MLHSMHPRGVRAPSQTRRRVSERPRIQGSGLRHTLHETSIRMAQLELSKSVLDAGVHAVSSVLPWRHPSSRSWHRLLEKGAGI